jgi:hypothetical protein
MPSDERISQALEALADAKETFVSSVAMSAEEVRGILEREQGVTEDPETKLAHELGPFAAGRIDLERFAPFVGANEKMDPEKRDKVEAAYETLLSLKKEGDDLFAAKVETDGYLRGTIISALGKAGASFGAARAVEWALHDLAAPETVDNVLKAFPPTLWNRAEKELAPPLVVEVDGQDLKAASLGDLLEGAQKIVLVVNGPAAPAPLVRLLTPGVAVIQTDDPAQLALLAAVPGPGIAALMPEGSAKFVHMPGEDRALNERLTVGHLPENEPKRALGGISAFQQAEELKQLAALAASVEAAPDGEVKAAREGPPPMDEAGQLASWLISQADVAGA